MADPWTYQNYWSAVFGERDAIGVVKDFELRGLHDADLDMWVTYAEECAWDAAGCASTPREAWGLFHKTALADLRAVVKAFAYDEGSSRMSGCTSREKPK